MNLIAELVAFTELANGTLDLFTKHLEGTNSGPGPRATFYAFFPSALREQRPGRSEGATATDAALSLALTFKVTLGVTVPEPAALLVVVIASLTATSAATFIITQFDLTVNQVERESISDFSLPNLDSIVPC